MQYWISKALAVSVMVSLTGCGVFTDEAHHKRNYRANEPVKAPEGLAQPAQDLTYKMDVAQYDNDPEAKNYRPPAQVITIAQGSWVEEGDKDARVYFDKNDGIVDLDEFIWDSINAVLHEENASATKEDKLLGKIETDWYSIIKPEDVWFWEDEADVSQQRFLFTIEEKSHQRTASLSSKLIDFKSDSRCILAILIPSKASKFMPKSCLK